MSATPGSIMIKTFGEMDNDNVDVLKQGQMQSQVLKRGKMQGDVLKQRQMQSDKLTRQFNSPTKPSPAVAGATKGQNEKNVVEDAKISPPRVKRNKTGPNQLSYKKNNVSAKHVLPEDSGGTTELKRLLTPINLFEDECIFCHSFRTSQFHKSMVCYLKGRIVSIEEGNSSNAIYVHKNCMEWAPRVWFKGDVIMNLESEIRRASRLRCGRCGLQGAALGCYDNDCKRSFHVPCALQIACRWDVGERHVLCPEHVSKTLPCDKLYTRTTENANSSSLHQSQCSYKEDSFTDFEEEGQQSDQLKTTRSFLPVGPCTDKEGKLDNRHRENQQTDKLNTSNAALFPQSPYIHKEVILDNHQRENQQTDQFNILNPLHLSQSKCSPKEGISTNSSTDGKQIDQLDTSSFSSLPLGKHLYEEEICMNCERDDQRAHKHNTSNLPSLPKRSHHSSCHPDEEGISSVYKGEEIKAYQPDTSSFPSDQLVLLGLSLTASEKDSLQEFACWTNARLMKEWGENVTHAIVGKGAGTSWSRSFEALMAILLGKWVVHFEWIADCSSEMTRRPEASYEVALSMDPLRTIDGPKKGRIRATKGAPKLFAGLRFCLSAYMDPDGRHRVRNLIAAAGGQVLREGFLDLLLGDSDGSLVGLYFVFDGDAPGEFSTSTLRKEVEEARKHAAAGARVISHLRLLDAVAAYDAEILDPAEREEKDGFAS
ncbi:BRCA1-associated RING domain protein 1-like isoform X4 [Panicum virgatum]|uniref:BRCA1-associated RING domain protein 1-like isoform X4 n=1 Tax=Panicum virgatum TaxID=38727 RepID=UPI0019D54FFB|nr:BRCA1-associated RING domain protein 1-like isoform X4 [Panicum virgatum]